MREYIQTPTTGTETNTKQPGQVLTGDAQKRQQTPFKSFDGRRDYRAMYADLYSFHRKYALPDIDDNGQTGGYWWRAGTEMMQLVEKYDDEFVTSVLLAVYNELEREFKTRKGSG